MKYLTQLFFIWCSLFISAQSINETSNERESWISTIDFVEILNGHTQEALYYYDNNWKVLRENALVKKYIESYQLLKTPTSDDNKIALILITTYSNQEQYDIRELHFEELIRLKGELRLLNEKMPKEFRKIAFSKQEVKH